MDFKSAIAVRKDSGITCLQQVSGRGVMTGDMDSPQASVVPLYWLAQNKVQPSAVQNFNVDVGKHGDTAAGEIKVLESLASDHSPQPVGLVSVMMWDRAVAGQLPSVDPAQLTARATLLTGDGDRPPMFDHCQFDSLASVPKWKQDAFQKALFAMNWDNPAHQPVMASEGLRREWMPFRDKYHTIRSALNHYETTHALGALRGHSTSLSSGGVRSYSTASTCATPLSPRKKVGVIGGGIAGLQVIRAMRARGHEVKLFEKAPDVGGVWRENYDGYGVQVPKQFFEFPDFPMTKVPWGGFPTGPQTQEYILEYSAKHKLMECVELNTEGWIAAREKCSTAASTWMDSFLGEVLHSSQLLDASMAKGRKVLVVGGSKSGTDCALVTSDAGAAEVTLLQRTPHWPTPRFIAVFIPFQYIFLPRFGQALRTPHWPTPRFIAGVIPFQYIFLSRFGQALVSAHQGIFPGAENAALKATRAMKALVSPIVKLVESIFASQLNLTNERRPRADVVADFYYTGFVLDNRLREMRKSGSINLRAMEIEKLTPDGVVLADGSKKEVDVVIFATGFRKDYSIFPEEIAKFTPDGMVLADGSKEEVDVVIFATGFRKDYYIFPEEILKRLDLSDDGLYLYRHMIPTHVPGVAFVGCEISSVSNICTQALQSEWLARHPTEGSKQEKIELLKIELLKVWKRSWIPYAASRAFMTMLHSTHYHDQLLKDMGEEHKRKMPNVLAEFLLPYLPSDYAGVSVEWSKSPVETNKMVETTAAATGWFQANPAETMPTIDQNGLCQEIPGILRVTQRTEGAFEHEVLGG
eukprot:gene19505-26171_t